MTQARLQTSSRVTAEQLDTECIFCGHTMWQHRSSFGWDEYISGCRACARELGTSQVVCFQTVPGAWQRLKEANGLA